MYNLFLQKKLNPDKYESDKKDMPHYVANYERHFSPLKNKPVQLLELGVRKGGSVKMWRDYFKKGTIVGIDIDPIILEDADRIRIYQGKQEDTHLLTNVANECAPKGFDIIIDDCAHIAECARTSFWHLFDNHLKSGGIYVIEDWGTGYWEEWPDGAKYTGTLGKDSKTPSNHQAGMVGLIKELVDECGAADITGRATNGLQPRNSKFLRIELSLSHCFIFKA